LCPRDEKDIESSPSQLEGVFLANSIRCTGDNRPRAFGSKLVQLPKSSVKVHEANLHENYTGAPGRMSKLANNRTKVKTFADT
jgi:hypothetical protein